MKTQLTGILLLLAATPVAKAQQDAVKVPGNWEYSDAHQQMLPTDDKWWLTFHDPVLTDLINRGETANYDVRIAAQRINTSLRAIDEAKSAYYPTASAYAGYDKQRQMKGMFNLGVQMNWEVDLFGRVSKTSDQAKANVRVSRAQYSATMVSMAAQIAKYYFNLRTNQQLLDVLKKHVESQQKIVHITEVRFETGLSSMLDVTQARTVLYTTQAGLPQIEASIRTDINNIALLIGEYPDAVDSLLNIKGELPDYRQIVAVGIPADLLRRRPDIVEAEYQIDSYAAALGIAKKEYLPTLELNGSIGLQNHNFGKLFTGNSFTWSISPTLSWTFFDGHARKYKNMDAQEQIQIGIDNYNLTVMTAINEVNNAISSYRSSYEEVGLLEKVMEESSKSLDLSLDLYKKGLSPFSDVMNAQITYLSNQSSIVSAKGDALVSLVQLYQALGGGFPVEE